MTRMVVGLSCILVAGVTSAIGSYLVLDERSAVPDNRSVSKEVQSSTVPDAARIETSALPAQAPELLPSLEPGPITEADDQPSRLLFVSPHAGELEIPEPPGPVAATPESWAVEVTSVPRVVPRALVPRRGASRGASTAPPRSRSKPAKRKRYTLKQRLAELAPDANARIIGRFMSAKAAWPPSEIAFVAIKDAKTLELHARADSGGWTFIHRYKVLAASGKSGPKLKRGDRQVPEGIYRISYLNPNSAYHVSLRVNYPNSFDREMARKDGRKDLGGDIMIHGKAVSEGCLAIGDPAAEELFVLAAEVGMRNIKVVIAPTDMRDARQVEATGPEWVQGLYTEIASAMSPFKRPPEPSLLTLLGL